MTREELKASIQSNMATSDIPVQDIRIQPDPFIGWRVAVIASGFSELTDDERRTIAFRGLDDEIFQWVELLTPDEKEWMGESFVDSDLDDIPAWPEALARPKPDRPIVFPSELEEDLSPPIIATFYSLRGGVGRSTAVAYTAWILAKKGYSVLCMDMDLEAPGLGSLFGFGVGEQEDAIKPKQGLVFLLADMDRGETSDVLDHIVRVSESVELYCLPAGIPSAEYARQLRWLNPESWYREERNPLHLLIEQIKDLAIKPDVILMDARTGISPINAPLLFDLSDIAVVTFFPHPQALKGTREIVDAILRSTNHRKEMEHPLTPDIRFLVSPVPEKPDALRDYRNRAVEWVKDWLSVLNDRDISVDVEEILHVVPYREAIATSDRVLGEGTISELYENIAEWVELLIPQRKGTVKPVEFPRQEILEELDFSFGTAEETTNRREHFVKSEIFSKALSEDFPLVLGRKGTGKTAVFRYLLEDQRVKSVPIMPPRELRDKAPWAIGPDGFQQIETALGRRANWRVFWTVYTGIAISIQESDLHPFLAEVVSSQLVLNRLQSGSFSQQDLVEYLIALLSSPDIGISAVDWLKSADTKMISKYRVDQMMRTTPWGGDDSVKSRHLLLYDGLDTGFGSTPDERKRRLRAIEGLLEFLLDQSPSLRHFRFKILLREDLWRAVNLQNKSHLFGRTVRLEWRSQPEFFKVILKRATDSPSFRKVIHSFGPEDLDQWTEDSVVRAWNVLVGERMKGSKTAFTRNWVWNRLADGNGDHSPRTLLQIFENAVDKDRQNTRDSESLPSIIDPKSLIKAFRDVSEHAVQTLREEFPELEPLFSELELKASPLDLDSLRDGVKRWIPLALEVGLLQPYDLRDGEHLRVRVPELYRVGLEMHRKGQA